MTCKSDDKKLILMNAALYALIVLLWGLTWIAIKNQGSHVPIEISVLYRFAIAGFILLFVMLIKRISFKYTLKQHAHMAVLGTLLFSTNFVFIYHGAKYLPSGLVAIIFSTSVIMIMLNSLIFFKKTITPRMMIGACMGILGLVCVFLPELKHFDLSNGVCLGLLLGFVGTYAFSLANHISGRCQALNIPLIASTCFGMLYGVLFLLLICWVKGLHFTYDTSLGYNLALFYLAIPGSVIGFLTYLTLVKRLGAERAVYATLLFPIVALVVSTLFESFTWVAEDYIGVSMILAGNALVMAPKGLISGCLLKLKGTRTSP